MHKHIVELNWSEKVGMIRKYKKVSFVSLQYNDSSTSCKGMLGSQQKIMDFQKIVLSFKIFKIIRNIESALFLLVKPLKQKDYKCLKM